jgi:hypothetical protein
MADERLFTRRLARVLDNPRGSVRSSLNSLTKSLDPIKEPGKNQTGAIILALILFTGSVLLWDVTHQKISIDEAESPTSASGSGEWLIWIEDSGQEISITATNVISKTNRTLGGMTWESPPQVVSSGNSFAVYDEFRVDYFRHDSGAGILEPIFSESSAEYLIDISISSSSSGTGYIAMLSNESLRIMDTSDQSIRILESVSNSSVIASSGPLVAFSENSPSGPTVNITSADSDLTLTILLDPRSSERIEESIRNSGALLDFGNSTIVELVMDSNWLVATVNVGPFNRTIIVDTSSINQTLISNPRWDSSSPSIGEGKVAFLQVTRDSIISTSQDSLRNNDVYVYYIESAETRQHTFDDDVDQFQPQILLDRLAWIEVNDQGEKQLLVYSFIDTIEPRNSLLLQASILAMIPLIFLWTLQSYGAKIVTQRV